MARKLSSVVGIDIGSQRIKIAELRSKGKDAEVAALGIIETPEGAVDQTGVYNSDAVGVALKQLLSQSGSSINQAVVSIAGQASVLVRTIEVPRMNTQELKDHMQWEIDRNIPFAESNVVSDFKPLPDDDPDSPNMDVVMAISPQSAIDTLLACLKKAGRSAVAIDVEPLGIARALQASYADELGVETVCVVDIGHKTTSINIYRAGKLLMPRQIPVGGEMITKAISDYQAKTMEEAEQIKCEKACIPASVIESAKANAVTTFNAPPIDAGLGATTEFQAYNPFSEPAGAPGGTPYNAGAPEPAGAVPYNAGAPEPPAIPPDTPAAPPPAAPAPPALGADPFAAVDFAAVAPNLANEDPEIANLYNAMANVVEEFVAEVRRSLDYFRSRGGEIDRLVLCGGGAKLKGLPEFLGASLTLECNPFKAFRHLSLNGKRVASEFAEEHEQEFAVAVGNGLYIFYD